MKPRIKVAYVISDLSYPPIEGMHQQTLLHIMGLRDAGVEVVVFGYCKNRDILDLELLVQDEGISFHSGPCFDKLPSLLRGGLNLFVPEMFQRRSEKQIRKTLAEGDFNVVHYEGIAACGLYRKRNKLKSIISFVDPGSLRRTRLARQASNNRSFFLHSIISLGFLLVEAALNMPDVIWHVVSPVDANYLRERFHHETVDIPIMLPAKVMKSSGDRDIDHLDCEQTVQRVLVFSDLRQKFSLDAFERFISGVALPASDQGAKFQLVVMGRVAPSEALLKSCERLDVEFLEWADDYLNEIRKSQFVVLPDAVGSGLKNRSVQCLGLGAAILGTSVAFEGIPVTSGRECIVVHTEDEFLSEFIRLCLDSSKRVDLRRRGQEFAKRKFSSEAVIHQWCSLYRDIIERDRLPSEASIA